MRHLLGMIFVGAMAAAFAAFAPKAPAPQLCKGADSCQACKTCQYCGHCNAKKGNHCGVCKQHPVQSVKQPKRTT